VIVTHNEHKVLIGFFIFLSLFGLAGVFTGIIFVNSRTFVLWGSFSVICVVLLAYFSVRYYRLKR
jgi:hypothetical protein